ncbi:sugar diacid recognition domain-containing protein [Paenibacillus cremeus]|uniref:sugar diacid recognition domain-containing protein n=1 Tax=Paenibacillus cremeus TaxID=2163881 RepID=UPI003704B9BD
MRTKTGTIFASGDSTRIGQKHRAAAEAIRTNRIVIVNENTMTRWRSVEFGINLSIDHDHKVWESV